MNYDQYSPSRPMGLDQFSVTLWVIWFLEHRWKWICCAQPPHSVQPHFFLSTRLQRHISQVIEIRIWNAALFIFYYFQDSPLLFCKEFSEKNLKSFHSNIPFTPRLLYGSTNHDEIGKIQNFKIFRQKLNFTKFQSFAIFCIKLSRISRRVYKITYCKFENLRTLFCYSQFVTNLAAILEREICRRPCDYPAWGKKLPFKTYLHRRHCGIT